MPGRPVPKGEDRPRCCRAVRGVRGVRAPCMSACTDKLILRVV